MIPLWLTEMVNVLLKNKQTLNQNYLVRIHSNMCVDREEERKISKVEAARRDQTVHRGAPTRDEAAIYTFKYVYRWLSRIHKRTCHAAQFKIFEIVAYLQPD